MLLIYNLLQIILVIFLLPILLVFVLLTPKYRKATWLRLGFGLHDLVRHLSVGRPRIWVHALSVGEVSSARALVRRLKQEYPDGVLIFSASTSSGHRYAASVLAGQVDIQVPFPLDLFWSVERFVRLLAPDVFVLVETDLWPNFLASLERHGVPALLVNGRISAESFQKYLRFRFLFTPLFRSFKYMAMQTEADAGKMKQLGVSADRLLGLGNLKYGVLDESGQPSLSRRTLAAEELADKRLWVAGSTHPGEEEIILKVYQQLRRVFNDLYLIIAPRNVERGGEIAAMAGNLGLKAVRRSEGGSLADDLLILDTLGELAAVYGLADFAFVGGSLVRERGHNPLEPAAFAKPVIFGPYMEDFTEIAGDLLAVGGACRVDGEKAMISILEKWLGDDKDRQAAGQCAARFVEDQGGVTARHVDLVRQVINERKE
ncbi:MAG: 3-deoxy-D-manno-octulosonic acid transferase [Thermodesulfobacteriota bacterium]